MVMLETFVEMGDRHLERKRRDRGVRGVLSDGYLQVMQAERIGGKLLVSLGGLDR